MGVINLLQHELRLFLIALQFLTRVPVPAWVGYQPDWLESSVRHHPVVGALIGGAAALVAFACASLWPPLVAATLAVIAGAWLTAAFHEDGLADTFDALLGSAPRDRALVIMRDSRIGSYGAVVLIGAMVLRIALVSELLTIGAAAACWALVASHSAGRAGSVVLMRMLPYARELPESEVKPLARQVRAGDALLAGAAGVAVLGFGLFHSGLPNQWTRSIAALLGLAVLFAAMRAWLWRRLGGYTGDTLGATEQLGEIVVLLAWAGSLAQ